MKKYIRSFSVVASTLGLVLSLSACNGGEISGQLSVQQAFQGYGSSGKSSTQVVIPVGDFPMKISAGKSNSKVELSVSGKGTTTLSLPTVPELEDTNFKGQLNLSSEKLGQPFDLNIQISGTTQDTNQWTRSNTCECDCHVNPVNGIQGCLSSCTYNTSGYDLVTERIVSISVLQNGVEVAKSEATQIFKSDSTTTNDDQWNVCQ